MKKSDIKVGKCYTDGKGNVREVVDEGPHCVLIERQTDTDCVRYRLIAKRLGPNRLGDLCDTTRVSFARWAKREVKRGEAACPDR